MPTVSQITRASVAAPYLSLVLDLDPAVIAELAMEMRLAPVRDDPPTGVEPTDEQVADAALRLMRLLDRPSSVPVLHAQLVRELHYWLLAGQHGPAIRRLGWPEAMPGGWRARLRFCGPNSHNRSRSIALRRRPE